MSRQQRRAAERQAKKRQKNSGQTTLENEALEFVFPFHPNALAFTGPIITTNIGISRVHAKALTDAGLPVPEPVRCRLLIDTGADGCVLKHEIAKLAGLKLINENTPVHGVGVDTSGKTYMGRIDMTMPSKLAPGTNQTISFDTQIMAASLPDDDNRLDGIIGRNILSIFEMNYNGKTGVVTMKFLGNN